MSQVKVSVLMPVYNGAYFISAAICSILAQTYRNFELLIYDDGSTDRTPQAIGLVKDTRVKVVRSEENKGVAYARNKLLEKATGEVIAHQDADDVSCPDRLELMLEYMVKRKLIFVCCSNKILGSAKLYKFEVDPEKALLRQFKLEKVFAGNNCMYSREVIDVGIRYDERLLIGEDTLFEAEIQAKFPKRMAAMEDILYLYRKHNDALTVKKRRGEVSLAESIILERNVKIQALLKPYMREERVVVVA